TQFDADMHNLGYKAPLVTYSENLLSDKTYTADKQKYFAASGKTMEEAIEKFSLLSHKLDSMQDLGLVKSYTNTDKLFIPLRVQQERIDAWKNYWTDERLQQVRRLIAETAPEAGLRPEAFKPFFESATANYETDALYNADIFPEGYLSTLMEQSYNGEYLCFTSVRCANDTVHSHTSDYYRICDAIAAEPDLMVLDTYYYTTDTLTAMNEDFNILQWVSMLFVFAVLLLSFRFNLKHTLLTFLPILFSWLIVLGAMVVFGMKFNLINIIISTFIFGIGVDYSIFVMNGLIGSEKNALLLGYHKTAIFFSAVTLIVTVSSMLFAKHPAIRSVGFSTLVGLVSAVVLSYVVQPAIFSRLNRKRKHS
ncbi:MAG: MMPL family transporter, partial [Prevotella sp.]|nr:MMPL family transporter [Prevotella sp.]